jgi:hypothetical protein
VLLLGSKLVDLGAQAGKFAVCANGGRWCLLLLAEHHDPHQETHGYWASQEGEGVELFEHDDALSENADDLSAQGVY